MTLVAAWVRNSVESEELVVASDSRLTGGEVWDSAQKIFQLPRNDCVLCFCGATAHAYPIIHQLVNAAAMFPKSNDRALDLTELRGHLARVVNSMWNRIADRPLGSETNADFGLLLAGFSWRQSQFLIWNLVQGRSGSFSWKPAKRVGASGCRFKFIGDKVKEANKMMHERLKSAVPGRIDMQPLEIVRDMVRDESIRSIGGPVQMVKVYRFMKCMPYNVYWPNRESGHRAFMGRVLLEYEANPYLTLDPDSLKTESPDEVRAAGQYAIT